MSLLQRPSPFLPESAYISTGELFIGAQRHWLFIDERGIRERVKKPTGEAGNVAKGEGLTSLCPLTIPEGVALTSVAGTAVQLIRTLSPPTSSTLALRTDYFFHSREEPQAEYPKR